MRIFLKKLHSKKGETYVEVLISVLIIALAALLLATTLTAANRINANARKADEGFYASVNSMENPAGDPAEGDYAVTYEIEGQFLTGSGKIDVDMYEDGELAAYKKKGARG